MVGSGAQEVERIETGPSIPVSVMSMNPKKPNENGRRTPEPPAPGAQTPRMLPRDARIPAGQACNGMPGIPPAGPPPAGTVAGLFVPPPPRWADGQTSSPIGRFSRTRARGCEFIEFITAVRMVRMAMPSHPLLNAAAHHEPSAPGPSSAYCPSSGTPSPGPPAAAHPRPAAGGAGRPATGTGILLVRTEPVPPSCTPPLPPPLRRPRSDLSCLLFLPALRECAAAPNRRSLDGIPRPAAENSRRGGVFGAPASRVLENPYLPVSSPPLDHPCSRTARTPASDRRRVGTGSAQGFPPFPLLLSPDRFLILRTMLFAVRIFQTGRAVGAGAGAMSGTNMPTSPAVHGAPLRATVVATVAGTPVTITRNVVARSNALRSRSSQSGTRYRVSTRGSML